MSKVVKSRNFCLVLYMEDKEQMKTLDFIVANFDYAFIYHDKDIWDNDIFNDDGSLKYKKGELKKPHYHVLISFVNPRSLKKVKEILNIDYIETCNFYFYTRYLVHLDDKNKFQYSRDLIETNISLRVNNALDKEIMQENQDFKLLFNFINSKNFVTFRDLTEFAIDNNLVNELKKNVYFYKQFCDSNYGFSKLGGIF